MNSFLNPPLKPRNGKNLQVLGIARISTKNQDPLSLEDQEFKYRRWLDQNYGPNYELTMIASQGSGELLGRQASIQAEEEVQSGKYDLVLTEALDRIFRRIHSYIFCETCEDRKTRLIAINDGVDTANKWRLNALFAVVKDEEDNRETSERIKRTLQSRFTTGGVFQIPIFGYIKGAGSREEDVRKDPAAAPIYEKWFQMLENGASYAEVADWLNESGAPVGPYSRDKTWSGRMVKRLTFNPILKGVRERNNKTTIRMNDTGKRVAVAAPPEDLLQRNCPHLAFFDAVRYDRLIAMLTARNDKYTRGRKDAKDARVGVPRKRTVWPGQHICCGICNRLYYWGGHGQADHMMCSGCRDYKCWNAATFDGLDASQKLTRAILAEIEKLPAFDATFLEIIREKAEEGSIEDRQELAAAKRDLESARLESDRIADAIAKGVALEAVTAKANQLTEKTARLRDHVEFLERKLSCQTGLPDLDEIKRRAREVFETLPANSQEFGRTVSKLIPSLKVLPYRLIDGGAIVLRATLTIKLVSLLPIETQSVVLGEKLNRVLTVDLFDPPQRELFRNRIVELRAQGFTEKQVAAQLGITVTAAQRASALQRLMDERGLKDPYELMVEPPASGRLRRHLSKRYTFEPLVDKESL